MRGENTDREDVQKQETETMWTEWYSAASTDKFLQLRRFFNVINLKPYHEHRVISNYRMCAYGNYRYP